MQDRHLEAEPLHLEQGCSQNLQLPPTSHMPSGQTDKQVDPLSKFGEGHVRHIEGPSEHVLHSGEH